jgi:hypothetical protein
VETLNQLVEICTLPPYQTASTQCHHSTQQVSNVMDMPLSRQRA